MRPSGFARLTSAATRYRESDRFTADALNWLHSNPTPQHVAYACLHYNGSAAYYDAIDTLAPQDAA